MKPVAIAGILPRLVKGKVGRLLLDASGGNTGNLLFTQATASHFPNTTSIGLDFNNNIEVLNSQYSGVVLSAANWINTHSDWSFLAEGISRLQIPCVCVGLGAQIERIEDAKKVKKGTIDLLDQLSQKSSSILVRGEHSRAILNELGFFDVRVGGCPSMVWSERLPLSDLPDQRLMPSGNLRLSVSQTRYALNDPHHAEPQRFIAIFAAMRASSIILQSEVPELLLLAGEGSSEEKDLVCSYYGIPSEEYNILAQKWKVFSDSRDWIAFHRDNTDLVISSRIHGCISAILSGKPAILLPHDCRTRELAESTGIPFVPIDRVNKLGDILEPDMLLSILASMKETIEAKRTQNLATFETVYKESGLVSVLS